MVTSTQRVFFYSLDRLLWNYSIKGYFLSFENLLDWASSENRPLWQRNVLLRLAKVGELKDDDLSELFKYIEISNDLSEENPPEVLPLEEKHLSEAFKNTPKTILTALGPVENVDRLEPNQPPLKFAQNGVTLIYGPNGSGKSGYCRITKHLCRAHAKETIKGNIYNDSSTLTAKVNIRFRIGEKNHNKCVKMYSKENLSPPELSRISVFDTASARVYVDKNRKIEFLPYELDLLNKLFLAVQEMNEKFKRREHGLNQYLHQELPGGFNEGTKVSKIVANLQSDVTQQELPPKEDIEKLGSWNDQDQKSLDLLARKLNEDPNELIRIRKKVLQSLDIVGNEIIKLEKMISDAALEELLVKLKSKKEKERTPFIEL